jgi:hypothetical protein
VPVSRVAAGLGLAWHTVHDAFARVDAQAPAWRAGITHVTIDMFTVYKSMVATGGLLPNTALTVAAFHVIQLARKMVGDVRRRVTFEHYRRRGRATDPEYTIKNLLVRGKERLSKRARDKLLCALADLGEHGRQIGAAWRAKNSYARSSDCPPTTPAWPPPAIGYTGRSRRSSPSAAPSARPSWSS